MDVMPAVAATEADVTAAADVMAMDVTAVAVVRAVEVVRAMASISPGAVSPECLAERLAMNRDVRSMNRSRGECSTPNLKLRACRGE
jgi:hypothetical protein